MNKEDLEKIKKRLGRLTLRERRMADHMFGINGGLHMTLVELAREYAADLDTIKEIKRQILKKVGLKVIE